MIPEATMQKQSHPGETADEALIGSLQQAVVAGSALPRTESKDVGHYAGTVTIQARKQWGFVDWRELYEHRDLFRFLVWREIKVRYAQSAIGIGWAVIQPVFTMLLFSAVFGRLAGVDSQGVPYALFSLAALVPWTYFSNAVTDGVNSLVGEANMLRKVYFPRLLMPLSSLGAKLVDFAIAMLCLALMMIWRGFTPPATLIWLPLIFALLVITAAACGIWLAALAVQYRDVKHALPFLVQIGMYASPVIYSASLIPEKWRLVYAINPLVGIIEGFRACLLGGQPAPWGLLGVGTLSAIVTLLSGLVFFRGRERVFADLA